MFSNFRQGYQVMKDHSKISKVHFWMIQGAKKGFLAIFWSKVRWIDLIFYILIVLNNPLTMDSDQGVKGHSRSQEV